MIGLTRLGPFLPSAFFTHIDEPSDVKIADIANALAAFMGTEWQSFDSPFDRFLRGDHAGYDPLFRQS